MAHHFTKAKSQRQNAEKASVAQVLATNKEVLSKLISTERTKLGFNNKNAKITAFENAQKEAATNASELMAEMKAEEGNFNIKRDILISQAKEKEQNVSADNLRQTLSGTGEEFNFTKVGQHQTKPVVEEEPGIQFHSNATYTDATGTHRDALGQAITTDTNVGKTTDEDAFAAIEAIKNEEMAVTSSKAEYIDPHKYNRDRKGQIITNTPAHNQLHSDETPVFVDDSISGNNQKVYAETLKLEKDTKESFIEVSKGINDQHYDGEVPKMTLVPEEVTDTTSKFAHSVAPDFGVTNPMISSPGTPDGLAAAIDQKNADNKKLIADAKAVEAAKLHDQFQNDRIDSIAKASDREEFRKNRELGEKNYLLSGEEAENSAKAIAEVERNGIGFTNNEITANAEKKARLDGLREQEVLRVERKQAHNLGQDAFSGQGTDAVDPIKNKRGILNRINEERTGGDFEGQRYANLNTGVGSIGQDIRTRQEQKLYEEQINNADANLDFSKTDTSPVANRRIGSKERSAFRKLQADKKAAADRVADVMDKKSNSDNLVGHQKSGFKPKFDIARGSNDDPYQFTTLAYPPDAVSSQENGHFMLFYVNVQNKTKYEYKGHKNGQVVPVGNLVKDFIPGVPQLGIKDKYVFNNELREAGLISDVEYAKDRIRSGGKGNILSNNQVVLQKSRKTIGQNLNKKYPTTTRITDSVALYLPAGIGNSTSVSYGDFQTGMAGYLAMSGIDVAKAVQEDDFVGAATQLFGKGGTLITDAIKKLALAGMETLGGGEGLQQNFDKIFGQTLNPYIEVAFQSSGMRTFDYTFNFAPKSKAETEEVRKIINLFRFHMLPEMKGTSHRYLTLPSTFDIHYMWQNGLTAAKENSFYNKIATCVLTNVDVNYTPNGDVQSFADGAPTQIAMSLSFKETEMLTKQHVNEGF